MRIAFPLLLLSLCFGGSVDAQKKSSFWATPNRKEIRTAIAAAVEEAETQAGFWIEYQFVVARPEDAAEHDDATAVIIRSLAEGDSHGGGRAGRRACAGLQRLFQ
ncbi:MAG: hypothetical protein R2724_07105 [Bryobacterales bacterium]